MNFIIRHEKYEYKIGLYKIFLKIRIKRYYQEREDINSENGRQYFQIIYLVSI